MDQINGVLQIGTVSDGSFSPITKNEFLEKTTRGIGTTPIIATETTVKKLQDAQDTPELDDNLIGTLVQLNTMQLISEERGRNFTDSDVESFTERVITDCADRATIGVLTDATANFRDELFPEEQGFIIGVYTNNGLVLRNSDEVKFANERCDFVEPTANVTITEVRAALDNGATVLTAENLGLDSNIVPIVSGYVISSDRDTNIQNTLYIQDAISNPTAGIAIDINQPDLYIDYPQGQRIYINLTGLGIDSEDPELHIGIYEEVIESIVAINPESDMIDDIIIRSQDAIVDITPLGVPIAAIENEEIPESILIAIDNLQLDKDEVEGRTFGQGIIKMFNCETKDFIRLSLINDEALFVDDRVPSGQATLEGITLKSNTFGETFILISNKENLNFTEIACVQ